MKEQDGRSEDPRLDTVLAALTGAEPRTGLQERVLRRLAAEPERTSRFARVRQQMMQQRFVISGAAAVVCMAAVFLQHAKQDDLGHTRLRATHPGSTASSQRADEVSRATVRLTASLSESPSAVAFTRQAGGCVTSGCNRGTLRRDTISSVRPRADESAGSNAAEAGSAHEPSSVAPVMPLTEQERLLLRIAHRDDPVQVAMLNPVERDLELARERAESARFFTPEPLPPDLQHEINRALRSQYVNTPPPSELFAQTADRSIP